MRIYDSESNPHDLCWHCIPPESEARKQYKPGPHGPDGRGNCYEYDAPHPWFFDGQNHDGDDWYADDGYVCEKCGDTLTQADVHPVVAKNRHIKMHNEWREKVWHRYLTWKNDRKNRA